MEQVIDFVTNINICYIVLNILVLIDIYLYLKKKNITGKKRRILLFCVFIASIIIFPYFNNIFQIVFKLKYLSVKGYLLILIATNIITLVTINKKLRISYEILNYTLFILMVIIFFSVCAIMLGNKIPKMYLMDIENVVILMNLSFVIFIIYLMIVCIVYSSYYVFGSYIINSKNNFTIFKNNVIDFWKKKKMILSFLKKKNSKKIVGYMQIPILTEEELLEYNDKDNFYINGVECSIIFEDSIEENIVKNYHILLEDIEAPMVNGFTLDENKLLKNICMKLQVGNLNNIDINNVNILNKISIEEYNLLKKIKNS